MPSLVYPRFSVAVPVVALEVFGVLVAGRAAVTFVLFAALDGVALAGSREVLVAGVVLVVVVGTLELFEGVAAGRVVVVVAGLAVVVLLELLEVVV